MSNKRRAGHWGEMYIPHVLCDGDKVISNVSVNLMQFDVQGVKKNYIQIGTVMTDEAHRGQGLNREIMDDSDRRNENDGMYMSENLGLYQFWMAAGFGENLFYIPETGNYTVAKVEGAVLHIHQILENSRWISPGSQLPLGKR